MKNIPLASKWTFTKKLIEQWEKFAKRLRWTAIHHVNKKASSREKETYGFKTARLPDPKDSLTSFENAMYNLISNIKFKNHVDSFQKELMNDVKEINSSDGVLVHGDKSNNIYVVPKKSYNKMVDDSVTKTYRKAAANTKNEIDLEGSEIAERLELADRMEVFAEKDPFITLKDHKANFDTKPTCRLINPAKSEMGMISKHILDKINTQIRRDTGYNQWKNTAEVIEWFKRLPDKKKRTFIQFDIESFYPSITLETLIKALTWAETIVNISPMEREIIMHARRSLLFHGGATWIKKDGSDFDVTMGSYDGAEVCELVGLYMLHLLSQRFGNDFIGLYRDD